MGALLVCVDCDSKSWTDLVEFDDMPIADWWASKGQRCVGCRRRAARRPDAAKRRGRRPAGLVGHADSATQRAGAAAVLPNVGTRRRAVYDLLLAVGDRGATFDELCRALGRSYSVTGPRVRELVRDGLVERAPGKRAGEAGVDQDVWRVTSIERVSG